VKAIVITAPGGPEVLAVTELPGPVPAAGQVRELGTPVDCVFDLVGNSVLRDSLRVVRARGRVRQLGFLGGLEPFASGKTTPT
jgi:NADPH:quinone reductase-like Zn-dependent oxidoreductase